jgi:hypothetical protein
MGQGAAQPPDSRIRRPAAAAGPRPKAAQEQLAPPARISATPARFSTPAAHLPTGAQETHTTTMPGPTRARAQNWVICVYRHM